MKKPSVFIGKPVEWIEKKPWLHQDNVILYNILPKIYKKLGCKVTIGKIKEIPENYDIVLAHHTVCDKPNVWNLKKGYLPNYMYFDRTGYSGWAEMATNVELYKESQRVVLEDAKEFFDKFSKNYISNNISKFPQDKLGLTKNNPELGNFNKDKPYIFIALQRPLRH